MLLHILRPFKLCFPCCPPNVHTHIHTLSNALLLLCSFPIKSFQLFAVSKLTGAIVVHNDLTLFVNIVTSIVVTVILIDITFSVIMKTVALIVQIKYIK